MPAELRRLRPIQLQPRRKRFAGHILRQWARRAGRGELIDVVAYAQFEEGGEYLTACGDLQRALGLAARLQHRIQLDWDGVRPPSDRED